MSYTIGWDYFTTTCEEFESRKCLVCYNFMECKRNVNGPRNYIEAISKTKTLHDLFTCKNSTFSWHKQLLKLQEKLQSEPSKYLRNILQLEIDYIVKTQQTTLPDIFRERNEQG